MSAWAGPVRPHAKVGRVAARTTTHLFDAAPFPQSVIERGIERIGDQAKRVQKVTLPRAVRTYEKRERPEFDIAGPDAPEVPEDDA
jgi:hypothetical protein